MSATDTQQQVLTNDERSAALPSETEKSTGLEEEDMSTEIQGEGEPRGSSENPLVLEDTETDVEEGEVSKDAAPKKPEYDDALNMLVNASQVVPLREEREPLIHSDSTVPIANLSCVDFKTCKDSLTNIFKMNQVWWGGKRAAQKLCEHYHFILSFVHMTNSTSVVLKNLPASYQCTCKPEEETHERLVINIPDSDDAVLKFEAAYSHFREFMNNALQYKDEKILVHCHRGINRSAFFLIFFLMEKLGSKDFSLFKLMQRAMSKEYFYQLPDALVASKGWIENVLSINDIDAPQSRHRTCRGSTSIDETTDEAAFMDYTLDTPAMSGTVVSEDNKVFPVATELQIKEWTEPPASKYKTFNMIYKNKYGSNWNALFEEYQCVVDDIVDVDKKSEGVPAFRDENLVLTREYKAVLQNQNLVMNIGECNSFNGYWNQYVSLKGSILSNLYPNLVPLEVFCPRLLDNPYMEEQCFGAVQLKPEMITFVMTDYVPKGDIPLFPPGALTHKEGETKGVIALIPGLTWKFEENGGQSMQQEGYMVGDVVRIDGLTQVVIAIVVKTAHSPNNNFWEVSESEFSNDVGLYLLTVPLYKLPKQHKTDELSFNLKDEKFKKDYFSTLKFFKLYDMNDKRFPSTEYLYVWTERDRTIMHQEIVLGAIVLFNYFTENKFQGKELRNILWKGVKGKRRAGNIEVSQEETEEQPSRPSDKVIAAEDTAPTVRSSGMYALQGDYEEHVREDSASFDLIVNKAFRLGMSSCQSTWQMMLPQVENSIQEIQTREVKALSSKVLVEVKDAILKDPTFVALQGLQKSLEKQESRRGARAEVDGKEEINRQTDKVCRHIDGVWESAEVGLDRHKSEILEELKGVNNLTVDVATHVEGSFKDELNQKFNQLKKDFDDHLTGTVAELHEVTLSMLEKIGEQTSNIMNRLSALEEQIGGASERQWGQRVSYKRPVGTSASTLSSSESTDSSSGTSSSLQDILKQHREKSSQSGGGKRRRIG